MSRRPRISSMAAAAVATVLAAAAAAPPARAQNQEGRTCIGQHCGFLRGFPVQHCHVRPGGGPGGADVCWSSLRGDFACELAGYTVNVPCPDTDLLAAGLGSQVVTSVGGYNVFRTEIRRTATARAAGEEGGTTTERAVLHFGEIHSALEYESWKLSGVNGDTPGARVSWRREGETGRIVSAAGSYQRAEADGGVSSDLASASAAFGHTLGERWRWSVNATASHLSGFVDSTLFGGGAQVYFESYFDGGQVLSGGATYQYTAFDADGAEDFQSAGAGIAYGFPVGRRLTIDLDLYGVSVIKPDLRDGVFYTGGAELGVYLTPRLTLTAGYRVLEGIDGLDSGTITFGAGGRW